MSAPLSPKEKRFLRYWADQKAGGQTKYLVLYTIAWSLIIILIPMAVSVFTDIFGLYHFYSLPFIVAILVAIIIAMSISIYSWNKNQKREKNILRKQAGNTGYDTVA